MTTARTDDVVEAAHAAARAARTALPAQRAAWLRSLADALEEAEADVVGVAMREIHLPRARLEGEVARTCAQLRMFADVALEGSALEISIDHADPSATPPHADLRRMLVPLGVVAIFAASNFPFAFSVLGGDTASALAAGNAVVVKAHPGHPELSQLVTRLGRDALVAAGAPAGLLGLVSGFDAGPELVVHPGVSAVGFTGSERGGRALLDLANAREEPIPFYGEFGSIKPVLVTTAAAAARTDELADGLIGSVTLGAGQFCTKPGVVLAPAGTLVPALTSRVPSEPSQMLTESIAHAYREGTLALADHPAVRVVAGTPGTGGAVVFAVDAGALREHGPALLQETFGATTLVVEHTGDDELLDLVELLPASLTGTIHAEPGEDVADLVAALGPRVGRLLFEGWPTGVGVTWAQHHGGPWPATTSIHTSVGATAIRRFQRPVVYQSAPAALLPPELAEDNPLGLPRRVDGRLEAGVRP